MARSKHNSSNSSSRGDRRIVYSEFDSEYGNSSNSLARERATPDLPPEKQNLRVQTSRKGRKGKTVTIVSGFQSSPDTLATLLKKLKTQCGAGGTIKENAIEIQGDCPQKVINILTSLGYRVAN